MSKITVALILVLTSSAMSRSFASDEATPVAVDPIPPSERDRMNEQQWSVLRENPAPEADARGAVQIHSLRGDALLFLGEYSDAVDEYRAMVRLRPELDASHWRLGIAYFFAERYEDAAAQFDRYHAFDNVDRENGIWRFLSHDRAFGAERARQELLRYDKDDREPFPAVFRLFDGSLTGDEVLRKIPDDLPAAEREKRLFYAELYIGMLHSVRQENKAAVDALRRAVSRSWPRTAGFGPNYMWHVARLEYDRLERKMKE